MLVEKLVERFFIENTLAVVEFDDVFGRFALSEPVDEVPAARLFVRFVVRLVPLRFIEGKGDFYGAFFGRFCIVLHDLSPATEISFYPLQYFSTNGAFCKAFFVVLPYIFSHCTHRFR